MPLDQEQTTIGSHAILITPDHQLILQRRNPDPSFPNAGKISLFGGSILLSEDPLMGLHRELLEELELDTNQFLLQNLGTYYKTQALDGIEFTVHVFLIRDIDFSRLVLHEGAGFVIETLETLLQDPSLTRITRLALEDLKQFEAIPKS